MALTVSPPPSNFPLLFCQERLATRYFADRGADLIECLISVRRQNAPYPNSTRFPKKPSELREHE
jgi:hypothetical protein